MKKVETTSSVKVHYTGRLEDGTIFDTSISEGREPLEVQLGQKQLISGFENGLIDMTEGEKKQWKLKFPKLTENHVPNLLTKFQKLMYLKVSKLVNLFKVWGLKDLLMLPLLPLMKKLSLLTQTILLPVKN